MSIRMLIFVGEGEILSLTMSEEVWLEHNAQAHWEIDCVVNEAMELAREEADYEQWLASAVDESYNESEWRARA